MHHHTFKRAKYHHTGNQILITVGNQIYVMETEAVDMTLLA